MPTSPAAARLVLPSLALSLMLLPACKSTESGDPGTGDTSFGANYGWTCASGQNCQDVFNFDVAAGSVLTVRVTNVSAGSVAQIALYGPGVALGGVNLFTGNTKELRCTTGASCDLFTAGEHVDAYTAVAAGVYRVAVTREWGNSCSSSGTYRLEVTSTKAFQVLGQTVEDTPSLASGFECH